MARDLPEAACHPSKLAPTSVDTSWASASEPRATHPNFAGRVPLIQTRRLCVCLYRCLSHSGFAHSRAPALCRSLSHAFALSLRALSLSIRFSRSLSLSRAFSFLALSLSHSLWMSLSALCCVLFVSNFGSLALSRFSSLALPIQPQKNILAVHLIHS